MEQSGNTKFSRNPLNRLITHLKHADKRYKQDFS
jgi:hypothetical protein